MRRRTLLGSIPALMLAGGSGALRAQEGMVDGTADGLSATDGSKMAWWREAKFGMFIHWGLFAQYGGMLDGLPVGTRSGEWLQHDQKIPVDVYAKAAARFNPKLFDADAWVETARAGGARYIVFTTKHHEGFAMYRSKVSRFNIYDATPFKRDPLRELVEACRRANMPLGFYYSQDQDWHHPGGGALNGHWDSAQKGDFATYLRTISVPQVRELLTNYGADTPAILWYDTPRHMTPGLARPFVDLMAPRPKLIVNNRLGGGYRGDTETPEGFIPAKGYDGRDWETCMRIADSWGFKYRINWEALKSPQILLQNLIDIASKGGNFLLNVGPNQAGEIIDLERNAFRRIGQWLKINGEAIYGASPTPFGAEAGSFDPEELDANRKPVFKPSWEWRCTTKGDKLYLHLLNWNQGKIQIPPVKAKVVRAYLLAAPDRRCSVEQIDRGVTVTLEGAATDDVASVVCLQLDRRLV